MHRTLLILTALSVALGLITLAPGSEAAQSFLPEPAPIDGPVSIGNRSLHVDCAGVGSPVVILEHGYGGSSEEWTAVQAELANQTRVCAYDRAGTGQSDTAPDQPHTARDVSRDLKALLHELDIEGPIVVAGFSIGGLFARYHATLLSDQIVGMVLIDSTPPVWPALSLSGLHARARGAMLRGLSGMNDSEPEMVDVLRSGVQVLAAPPAEIPVTMVTAGIKSLQPALAGDDLDRVLTRLQLEQAVELGAEHQVADLCPHTLPVSCAEITAAAISAAVAGLSDPASNGSGDQEEGQRPYAIFAATSQRQVRRRTRSGLPARSSTSLG